METRSLYSLRNLHDGELEFSGYYECPITIAGHNCKIRFDADVKWSIENGVISEESFTNYGSELIEVIVVDVKESFSIKELFNNEGEVCECYDFLNDIRDQDININVQCDYDIDLKSYLEDNIITQKLYDFVTNKVTKIVEQAE